MVTCVESEGAVRASEVSGAQESGEGWKQLLRVGV